MPDTMFAGMDGPEDEAALQERLEYMHLSSEDAERLREFHPVVERCADDLVAAFYRHLLAFEPTSELLRDPVVRDRLLSYQKEYLLSLTSSTWDRDYVQRRLTIGITHERVGLSPSWYMGAYSLYIGLLNPIIDEEYRSQPARGREVHHSLVKVLLLDAQLAMESYINARQAQLDFLNRELAAAGRGLAKEVDEQKVALRASSERAQAAEQLASVGTVAAGLAHEIGTPMGVIRGHAELLEKSVEDDKGRWRLQTILEQIDRISRIMQALLNLARRRETERAPIELQPVIETALSFLTEKLSRRRIVVETGFEATHRIWGDGEKLQQLFLNLFLNAADAMPSGGKLVVRTSDSAEGGVCATVSDDGCGIPERDVAQIFEPFFTSKEAGQGSGLGLVVSKGIISEHGGEIRVESEEGGGTVFEVCFPPDNGASR